MELRHIASRDAKLLSILRRELGLSSGLTRRLKYRGAYYVNGTAVHTDYPVHPGDEILVCLDESEPDYPAEPGWLYVAYEDEWLLAVDKPAGMLVHPSAARNTGTLANRLLAYYRETGQKCAVHPVSRLDRDTFGLVLLAKNAHIHAKMCDLSHCGQIEKRYHALVYGAPAEPEGLISAPIARPEGPSLLRCIAPGGKDSRSAYRVLETCNGVSLLELRPLTGRTHQLRLHCVFLGCPILGDAQYGSTESQAFSARFGLTGQQLCAVSLRFVHPITGKMLEIRSKMDVSLDFLTQKEV